jgi:Pectic acid lyase/Concanavalin A-like lectin/glucanases superfamily
MTRLVVSSAVAVLAALGPVPQPDLHATRQTRAPDPSRSEILAAMKRATTFMVERVSTNGGYVWAYLPDLSRRWGEIEARPSIVWIQPPGTATMAHLFLDAYHATGDEYYYLAAEKAAGILIWSQHPSGGWNYVADLAGDRSLRDWYASVGKNAWRLEEFQHYWDNATFDDVVTVDAARLLLRVYLEKRDPKYKPALDKAVQFVLDSQYPIGGWPQRYPPKADFVPDYTAYITFNDDVAAENIEFLLQCYQTLGETRLVDPILRGMQAFIVMQQGPPQPGWALQYTPDFQPAGARTYEPRALVTHTTARNIELLVRFYRLTGDRKFLARVPEAIDWLAGLTLPPGIAPAGRTHPTFVEIGTNRPLYVHREGSNVINGRYYVNYDPAKTIGHYSAFRRVDIAALRKLYDEARALSPADASKGSPLADATAPALMRFVALDPSATESPADVIGSLGTDGAWIAPLEYISHPYRGDGPKERPTGDFSQTHVGDDSDTSPFPNTSVRGISTTTYIRRMTVLIRALEATPARSSGVGDADGSVTWRLDNLTSIGGHPAKVLGTPRVVPTSVGPVIEFNGRSDGLVLDTNPLEGLRQFTLEAQFEPAADGLEEQRFLHIEEHETGNRALLETRMLPDRRWCLDTFLNSGPSSRTLIDRERSHPAGEWHAAALMYDGVEMTHYVDGKREAAGPVTFAPLGAGRTALGVRLNQVSWFKGRLRLVRITPQALPPDRLLKKPGN